MQKYQNNVQDQFGNAITGVIVTIRTNPGGVLATIFSDNGVTGKANPFTNDADGEFFFYAANGRYDIELTGTILETKTDFLFLDLSTSGGNVGITADINTATPPTSEAVTAQLEYFDLAGDDLLAQVGFNASNTCRIANRMHGGAVQLNGEDVSGNARVGLTVDPDAAVTLAHPSDNVARFSTGPDGEVNIHSNTNADGNGRLIQLTHQDGTVRGFLGHMPGFTILQLQNDINGGGLNLNLRDGGGSIRSVISAMSSGDVDIYYSATDDKRISTQAGGIVRVYGDGATDAENRYIVFSYQTTDTDRGIIGYVADDVLRIRNQVHGGNVTLDAENVSGTARTFLVCNPDAATQISGVTNFEARVNITETAILATANGNVQLYWNSIAKLRTQDNTIADAVSGAEVLDGNNVWQEVGFNVLGQQLSNGAYTIHRSEAGYDVYKNAGAAATYTIPASASAGQTDIPIGAVYEITNEDTEVLTIDGTQTGITLRWLPAGTTGNRSLAQWGKARLQKRSDSLWFITGVGIT